MLKNYIKAGVLSAIVLTFASCKDDDNNPDEESGVITSVDEIDYDFSVPSTYVFERDGATTVSFSGQTTRLEMNKEILGYFGVDSGKTAAEIEAAFDHSAGNQDFSTSDLNDSSKSVKSKIAVSDDLFGSDAVSSDGIKAVFSGYISSHVADVVPNKDVVAEAGVAGYVGTRYVNEKGLEYNQSFAKGSIGALIVDQVLNNYLGDNRISNEEYITNNTNEVLEEGKTYTKYEHHFDEAYGYVYGDPSVDSESPILYNDDSFLFKYISQVSEDSDFSGIQNEIFNAFKIGRSSVVAQDYEVLDDAISVLQYQISKVVGIRAVYYLQSGKRYLATQEYASAFHALSEGYGFIYSLQFTRNPETGIPYLSASEVASLLSQLEAGNGFWDLENGTVLEEISNTIADKFDFTLAEAATN